MRPLSRLLPCLLLVSCSWSRFDEVTENTPILLLNRPAVLDKGFGVSLATVTRGDQVQVLVGGAPILSGAAAYQLGTSDQPSVEAIDTGFCRGTEAPCFLSSSPAGLPIAAAPDMSHDRCFVVGSGRASAETGAVIRCADDDLEYALPVPDAALMRLDFTVAESQGEDMLFAADRSEAPALLASYPIEKLSWFYDSLGRTPVSLLPMEVPEGFGKKLAVVKVGDTGRLFAVGANDRIILFKTEDGQTATELGCLGTAPGFGRGMTTGPVLAGDTDDELVVADDANVYVFDGRVLFEMPPAAGSSCSLASLPEGALITSFTCGSTKNVADCQSSRFGEAIAVGDIDGDGDGEVAVGAPGMTVRGEKRAGAVLIYDVDAPRASDFAEIQFISSADQDDELGRALVMPSLGDRSIVVAGAPGNGKVALFYCSSLLPADKRTSRCK